MSLVMSQGVAAAGIEIEPPGLRIKNAMHAIETQVDEPDLDVALRIARSRFALAAAVLALASAPEWGPAFTFHRVRPVGQDAWRPAPVSSKFGGVPVGTADEEGKQRIASLLTLLRDDPPTRQLLDLWYSAMEYERRAFELVDLEHILIRYVKVFERVARAMSPELHEAVDAAAEADAIEVELARLPTALTSAKSTANKANITVEVAGAIERIRLNSIGRLLGAAAESLELDDETKAAERRAWVARSTKAGHPPDAPSEVTLDELLDAREAAGKYLIGYLMWRSRRRSG